MHTWFAPAERATPDQLSRLAFTCLKNPIVEIVLQAVDGFVLILNRERQVLAANPEVLQEMEIEAACITGLRPGELFGCIHSKDEPGGCGTSRTCTTCGAVVTLLASQVENRSITGECLMTVRHKGVVESREFQVRATPLSLSDDTVTVFTIHDISALKRRELLEKVFLHDALNIVTSLQNWGEMLKEELYSSRAAAEKIVELSKRLGQEVQTQWLILQAEKGELQVQNEIFTCSSLFMSLRTLFEAYHYNHCSRFIATDPKEEVIFGTDSQLLLRVLINMIKNGLEASEPGGKVRIWLEIRNGCPCFLVHNDGWMAEDVQLRVFERSFSTKTGSGRGIGTYSMRLFGERYLNGSISFTSREADGTRFLLTLPSSSLKVKAQDSSL